MDSESTFPDGPRACPIATTLKLRDCVSTNSSKEESTCSRPASWMVAIGVEGLLPSVGMKFVGLRSGGVIL